MSATPPEIPQLNDVRVIDGELQYYDGTEWRPYLDVTELQLEPNAVIKDDPGGESDESG